jgi:hypothetical protein
VGVRLEDVLEERKNRKTVPLGRTLPVGVAAAKCQQTVCLRSNILIEADIQDPTYWKAHRSGAEREIRKRAFRCAIGRD